MSHNRRRKAHALNFVCSVTKRPGAPSPSWPKAHGIDAQPDGTARTSTPDGVSEPLRGALTRSAWADSRRTKAANFVSGVSWSGLERASWVNSHLRHFHLVRRDWIARQTSEPSLEASARMPPAQSSQNTPASTMPWGLAATASSCTRQCPDPRLHLGSSQDEFPTWTQPRARCSAASAAGLRCTRRHPAQRRFFPSLRLRTPQ